MAPLLEKNVQLVLNTPYFHFCLKTAEYDTDDHVTELRYSRKQLILEKTMVDSGRTYYQKKCEDCGKIFRLLHF
jgi:hypothetical protein